MENKKVILKWIHHHTAGDCTSYYETEIAPDCTLKDFVDELKSETYNSGYIIIGKDYFSDEKYRYSKGSLKELIPREKYFAKIIKIKPFGGYSLMNYVIELEGTE